MQINIQEGRKRRKHQNQKKNPKTTNKQQHNHKNAPKQCMFEDWFSGKLLSDTVISQNTVSVLKNG